MIILRLISEWHSRGSLKSQWGVIGAAARAMGVMRRRKVSDPNETVQIPNTRLSPKAYSESSPSSLIDEPIDEDVEYESISFNALEGILSVMLAIMSRPQSESSWKMSAPILDSLLREHCKVLFASLHPRKINAPLEEYPPSPPSRWRRWARRFFTRRGHRRLQGGGASSAGARARRGQSSNHARIIRGNLRHERTALSNADLRHACRVFSRSNRCRFKRDYPSRYRVSNPAPR